jgi:PilZ domain-containing protein
MPMECLIYRGGEIAVQESSEMLKLSSQQYAGVVASLQSAASSAGSDKRQCTRMEIQAPVRLAIMADNKVTRCVIALIRDVSLTGVGLCQAPKFVPKENFLISLPCAKKPMVVLCSTTFCRPLADGIFWVGAQFESEADPAKAEEFRAFAAAAKAAA